MGLLKRGQRWLFTRVAQLVVVCLTAACATAWATEPARPLTPEEHKELEKKAEDLQGRSTKLYGEGKLDEALRVMSEAVQCYEKLYPEGHADLADSLNSVGFFLQLRGEYIRAQPTYERSLAMRKKLYPVDRYPDGHPGLAASLNNLGLLLQARGELARAQPYLEQALANAREVSSDNCSSLSATTEFPDGTT
jgi:tetratricopeptide (TPR) repeat protein